MRVVIAGQTYYPASNGQAVFTVQLAEGLVGAGHEVMVITPSDQRSPYMLELNGVRVEKLHAMPLKPNYPDVYLNLPPGRRIDRLFGDFRPDIVHIQDHYPLCRSVVSTARRWNIPSIGTNHFLPENIIHYLKLPTWTARTLEQVAWFTMLELYNRLDVATTPTETAASILQQQAVRIPVYPISCGVDLERFRLLPALDRTVIRRRFGLDPTRTLFLFVGRIDQEKRIDVLIRALHHLDRPDIQLGIAGRGRYLDTLVALVAALGLEDRVIFTGYVSAADLPSLLNSADVFAMPSEAELQSIATLEAMGTGRPILAANARALPELVEHGSNGYLFRPGDHEDAAQWMARLADEPQRRDAMGAAGLQNVVQHSLAGTIEQYESLYYDWRPDLRPQALFSACASSHEERVSF